MYRSVELHDHSSYMLTCENAEQIANKISEILNDTFIIVRVEEYFNWEPRILVNQKLYKTNEYPTPISFIKKCAYSCVSINVVDNNYSFSSNIESNDFDYKFQRQSIIEFGYREFMIKTRNGDNQVIIWKFKAT